MLNFNLDPQGYEYRALKFVPDNMMRGWDVYALQTGLVGVTEIDIKIDGWYGKQTRDLVLQLQTNRKLEPDSIAGIATQHKIAQVLARRASARYNLPVGIPYGHIEKECGFQLGNYTKPYPNGKIDAGATQRNTLYATLMEAFNTDQSIHVLSQRIKDYWEKYQLWGVPKERALELACGSWNAPAWTDALAKGEYLGPQSTAWIEAYIDRVMTYYKK